MPTIADVFNSDAFSCYSLTAAIEKIPMKPSVISDLGIFRSIPINTTTVMIEERDGVLALVPTTKRGGAGIPAQRSDREARPVKTAHIQLEDTLQADDVINVRAFGSADPASGIGAKAAELLIAMSMSIDATNEYLKAGALVGTITYPTNSVDSNLSLATLFGVTLQTQDCALTTDATAVVESIIPSIHDKVRAGLGDLSYDYIKVLASSGFMRALVSHPLVRNVYDHQQPMWATQQMTVKQGNRYRMRLAIGGCDFEEYYDAVGSTVFITANTAIAFPVGPDIYHSYFAPADFIEAVGTMGQAKYARQYPNPDGKSVQLETQSNPLHLCLRPRACVRCSKTAF